MLDTHVETREHHVVVIGGGGSGLAAAISAPHALSATATTGDGRSPRAGSPAPPSP